MNIKQMRIILILPLLTTVIQILNGNINVNINTDRLYILYPLKDDKCVTLSGGKCILPFIYDGTEYNGCTSIDHHGPWCATTVLSSAGWVDMWENCASSCKLHSAEVSSTEMDYEERAVELKDRSQSSDYSYDDQDDKCVTDGGKQIGVKCVFPFMYHGTAYNGCTSIDHHEPWCATTLNLPGNMDMWGNCPSSCKLHSAEGNCVTDGGKQIGVKCIFPFIYHGTEYNGCISIDHHAPWCATTVNLPGNMDMWGNCPSSCNLRSAGCFYKSLGCWNDRRNRTIPTLEGTDNRLIGQYWQRNNDKELCFQVAKSKGYRVFAIQNGGHCAGSSTALNTYRKYGVSTGCKDGKGGMWANDVYQIECIVHNEEMAKGSKTDDDDNYNYIGNKINGSGNNNVGDNNGNSYKTECILGMIPSSDYNGNCQCFCGGDWEKALEKENVVAIKKTTKN